MPGNTIGVFFKVTTWGESHGRAIGAVVDGCPPGIDLTEQDIQVALDRRKPGRTGATSSRKEADAVEILSGVFDDKTTGTPISLMIRNKDAREGDYDALKEVFRPGHGDFRSTASGITGAADALPAGRRQPVSPPGQLQEKFLYGRE